MYMYIHTYIHTYIYINILTYIYVFVFIFIYIYIYTYMYIYIGIGKVYNLPYLSLCVHNYVFAEIDTKGLRAALWTAHKEPVQGQQRQSADINGDVCRSTLSRFPDTWHLAQRSRSLKMWFRNLLSVELQTSSFISADWRR